MLDASYACIFLCSLLLISIQVVLVSKSVLHICIKRQLMHAWLSVATFFIERILETTLHLQTDATSYVKINKNLSACRFYSIFSTTSFEPQYRMMEDPFFSWNNTTIGIFHRYQRIPEIFHFNRISLQNFVAAISFLPLS